MIPEVHHCAGGLCPKVTCAFVLHLLSQNCLYFLIHPRIFLMKHLEISFTTVNGCYRRSELRHEMKNV
jgi:hypothetical protein